MHLASMYSSVIPTSMAAAPASSTTSSSSSSSSGTSSSNGLDPTFMSLLLAELQSQDPTSPMDTTAMVGQMVSLNQLDELMSIQSILQNSLGSGATATTAPTTSNQAASSLGAPTTAAANSAQSTYSPLATTAPFSNAQSTYSLLGGATAPLTSTQYMNGAN